MLFRSCAPKNQYTSAVSLCACYLGPSWLQELRMAKIIQKSCICACARAYQGTGHDGGKMAPRWPGMVPRWPIRAPQNQYTRAVLLCACYLGPSWLQELRIAKIMLKNCISARARAPQDTGHDDVKMAP